MREKGGTSWWNLGGRRGKKDGDIGVLSYRKEKGEDRRWWG